MSGSDDKRDADLANWSRLDAAAARVGRAQMKRLRRKPGSGGWRPGAGRKFAVYEVPDLAGDAGGGVRVAVPGPLRLHDSACDPSPLAILVAAMVHHFERREFDRATQYARDAAPYYHPKRQNVEHAGNPDRPLRFLSMSDDALDRLIACLVMDRGERQ
jgi:hypothetical protein